MCIYSLFISRKSKTIWNSTGVHPIIHNSLFLYCNTITTHNLTLLIMKTCRRAQQQRQTGLIYRNNFSYFTALLLCSPSVALASISLRNKRVCDVWIRFYDDVIFFNCTYMWKIAIHRKVVKRWQCYLFSLLYLFSAKKRDVVVGCSIGRFLPSSMSRVSFY